MKSFLCKSAKDMLLGVVACFLFWCVIVIQARREVIQANECYQKAYRERIEFVPREDQPLELVEMEKERLKHHMAEASGKFRQARTSLERLTGRQLAVALWMPRGPGEPLDSQHEQEF